MPEKTSHGSTADGTCLAVFHDCSCVLPEEQVGWGCWVGDFVCCFVLFFVMKG